MENKLHTDIAPLNAEIEAIFSGNNIDDDCDNIAQLLSPYRKKVCESLNQGITPKP